MTRTKLKVKKISSDYQQKARIINISKNLTIKVVARKVKRGGDHNTIHFFFERGIQSINVVLIYTYK